MYNSSGKSRTSKTVMAMIVLDSKGGKLGPSNFMGLVPPSHPSCRNISQCFALALGQEGVMGGERGRTKGNP